MKQILSSILATSLLLSVMTSSLASEIAPETEENQVYTQTLSAIALSSNYAKVDSFSEGFAVVTTHDGKKGVIDHNGTEIVPPSSRYARIGAYRDGYALFDTCANDDGEYIGDLNGTVGYLNTNGEEAITFSLNREDHIGDIYGFQNGLYGYVDQNGI